MERGELVPDAVVIGVAERAPGGAGRAPRLRARRLPAHDRRRPRRSTRMLGRARHAARALRRAGGRRGRAGRRGCCAAPRSRAAATTTRTTIRTRMRVYRAADRAAAAPTTGRRGLLREVDAVGIDRRGREADRGGARVMSYGERIPIKTRRELEAMRERRPPRGRGPARAARAGAAGHHHRRSSTRSPRRPSGRGVCESSFKGYDPHGLPAYPAVLCVSVNEEIVHGIPGPRELAARGHREPRLRRLCRTASTGTRR